MLDIDCKKNFGGQDENELKQFKFEESTLHTIVYGATGSGNT